MIPRIEDFVIVLLGLILVVGGLIAMAVALGGLLYAGAIATAIGIVLVWITARISE